MEKFIVSNKIVVKVMLDTNTVLIDEESVSKFLERKIYKTASFKSYEVAIYCLVYLT